MDINNPPNDPSLDPFYNKHLVNRILDVVRSHRVYDQRVIDQILDIASDCEPSPLAPQQRFYYSREDGQGHLKQFAAHHGYALNVRRSDNHKVDMVCSRWPDPKSKATDNDGTPSGERKSNGCNCQFLNPAQKAYWSITEASICGSYKESTTADLAATNSTWNS